MKERARSFAHGGKPSRLRSLRANRNREDLRTEIALALYPRYLDFMEERDGDADLPPYDFRSAAGDAVRAADYLIEAIEEGAQ